MKIIRNGWLILPLLIFSSSSVYASSVEIEVRPTTVGNLLFRVRTLDNEKVPDDTQFDLYEIDRSEELTNDLEDYELVESSFSENSIVFFENIPFGEYFVRASDENPYVGYKRVFINEDTVDTQHIAKKLLVDIDTENVPDNGSGNNGSGASDSGDSSNSENTSNDGSASNESVNGSNSSSNNGSSNGGDSSNASTSKTDISEIVKNDFNSKGNNEQEDKLQYSDDVSTGDKVNYTPHVFLALASSLLGIMLYRRRCASEDN